MKLRQLSVEGFRSHKKQKFSLVGPHVLFTGVNGSGKTSIREAIRWVLTGHCLGTDARGAGSEVLIPVGSKMASAEVVIDGIGSVARTYADKTGGTFQVEGLTGTSQTQMQALYEKLGTQPAYMDAVLSTETFLDLTHAAAKWLVLSLLDVKIPVADKSYTLDELDILYKEAFEERKQAKKLVVGFVIPPRPVGDPPPPDEAIEAQLTKLRKDLGDLRQQIGGTIATRVALTAELQRVQLVRPPEDDDTAGEILRVEAEIAALTGQAVAEVPNGDPGRLVFLRSKEDALRAHRPSVGCVLNTGVPCNTHRDLFVDMADVIGKEALGLEGSTPGSRPPSSALASFKAELKALQTKQASIAAGIVAFKRSQEREAEIHPILAGLPETVDQEKAIVKLEERIANGETFKRSAREWRMVLDAHDRSTVALQGRQAEVDRLEALCDVLGPNGARVAALDAAMGRFMAAVNPWIDPYGWVLSFRVDPWQVLVNDRPVETYSKSEQYRIGIALQIGVAKLSGLNFVIVDEVDMLDLDNRAIATRMLLAAKLEQVIVMGTRDPSVNLPKGTRAYRLERKGQWTEVVEVAA